MGNICRSPTAEEVLRVKARQAGLSIEFDSAGTENYHIGDAPDPRSVRHARVRGYDLSALRARQVQPPISMSSISSSPPTSSTCANSAGVARRTNITGSRFSSATSPCPIRITAKATISKKCWI